MEVRKVKLIGIKTSKLLLSSILGLFFLASIIAGVTIVKNRNKNLIERSHAAGVEMTLISAKTNILPNEEFNVQVYLNTKDLTVSGAQIRVKYDSNYFEAKNITPGNFLPVILKAGDLSTTGVADITLGSQPENPKKGTGVLATVKFKAKTKKGNSNIFFGPGYTEVAAIGQSSNVAGDFQPLILTVDSAATATATPTATPSRTPTPPTRTPTPTSNPIPPGRL